VRTFVKPATILVLLLLLAVEAHGACTVSATGINFGGYDVFVATPLDSTGSVTVSCDRNPPTDVTVAIGPSATSGGFNPRSMRHPSRTDRLNYNLFTSPSMNVVWGDGTAGTATVFLFKVNKNRPQSAMIYGRILPGQNVSVGSYGDRLTVTITP
jgi:spore coat protein U-like protein